mmetsp:Transcript_74034/g.220907  ORF Transcript_74034/g.220907 Transcript_74034/m.220907 type:complete len:287 (-) Transcript_74034:2211-3071(-)
MEHDGCKGGAEVAVPAGEHPPAVGAAPEGVRDGLDIGGGGVGADEALDQAVPDEGRRVGVAEDVVQDALDLVQRRLGQARLGAGLRHEVRRVPEAEAAELDDVAHVLEQLPAALEHRVLVDGAPRGVGPHRPIAAPDAGAREHCGAHLELGLHLGLGGHAGEDRLGDPRGPADAGGVGRVAGARAPHGPLAVPAHPDLGLAPDLRPDGPVGVQLNVGGVARGEEEVDAGPAHKLVPCISDLDEAGEAAEPPELALLALAGKISVKCDGSREAAGGAAGRTQCLEEV